MSDKIDNKKIYLDYAAMTPIDTEVLAKMNKYYSNEFGNPSSMYESGRKAMNEIFHAREIISKCICADPKEILFTASGTESDNLAIFGVASKYEKRGKHIIISSIEHKAVLESANALKKRGFEISNVSVDSSGFINKEELISLVRPDTILISIIYVNNEIGVIQNIPEIFNDIRKKFGKSCPVLHTDACQAVGHVDIDVKSLGADLVSMNSSKIYGPKGVGILYKNKDIGISSLIFGGAQEFGIRAGTESVPQIMGCALAFEKATELRENEEERYKQLRNHVISSLRNNIPSISFNGHCEMVANHILHMTIPKIEGESIILLLDQYGIEVSTGSACSSNDLQASHVLYAIGQSDELIHGSIRISFGRDTQKEDLDYFVEKLKTVVEKLLKISVLTSHEYERK